MKLHILGICGTFMSGIAMLAKQNGYHVVGSDENIYPPMSNQLADAGIQIIEGYSPQAIDWNTDHFIVGNVIKRGNPIIEHILSHRISYSSGPAWLFEYILKKRLVLAVAGTHGKTTTTSLLTFLLEKAGYDPGFLIGGIPENFGYSARLGSGKYFVIEADEYDSAFFDKSSKFMHYHPNILILNNIEYDHADIFPNLSAIKKQFHYLIRTVPGNGCIIYNARDKHLADVLQQGSWTPLVTFASKKGLWQAQLVKADGSEFHVFREHQLLGTVKWSLLGSHNVENALAALAAAHEIDIPAKLAIPALTEFKNVKRRLEIKGIVKGVTVYDDFAHHPTAIAATLAGLRSKINQARLIAIVEFGSYTMQQGIHKLNMQTTFQCADMVICKATAIDWGLEQLLTNMKQETAIYQDVDTIIKKVVPLLKTGDHVVIMSNKGFDNIHDKLLSGVQSQKLSPL